MFVDSPMSPTPKDAGAGGSDVNFARARPVFDAFAGRVVHTGPTGSGHTMKLLANFVSLGYVALYAEALALGVANPLGSAVRNSFPTAVGTVHGDKYVPMLSDVVADLNGASLTNPGNPTR